MQIQWQHNTLVLLGEKALWLPKSSTLVVSDVHLGKITHFRKNGLAVPNGPQLNDLQKLQAIIDRLQPETLVFLGDLFHSDANSEWHLLEQFVADNSAVNFVLVEGNHDVLHPTMYTNLGFKLLPELQLNNLVFVHDLPEALSENKAYIFGHIHPAVQLKGTAKQRLKLPCFYAEQNTLNVPAFGSFTGSFVVHPKKESRVFVIANQQVLEVPTA